MWWTVGGVKSISIVAFVMVLGSFNRLVNTVVARKQFTEWLVQMFRGRRGLPNVNQHVAVWKGVMLFLAFLVVLNVITNAHALGVPFLCFIAQATFGVVNSFYKHESVRNALYGMVLTNILILSEFLFLYYAIGFGSAWPFLFVQVVYLYIFLKVYYVYDTYGPSGREGQPRVIVTMDEEAEELQLIEDSAEE